MKLIRNIILIHILVFFINGCATLQKPIGKKETAVLQPLTIEDVSLAKKIVNLTKGEQIEITYNLKSYTDTVEITFYNSINEPVKEIQYQSLSEGIHKIIWDGKTNSGEYCESDVYTYVIKAQEGMHYFTYNPAVNTGNKRLEIEKADINKDTLKITYVLPEAAWVRLRLGLREGVLLNTIFDWQAQEAGRHEINWDGWDTNRFLQFAKDPKTALAIEAYSLPANSVIIQSGKAPDYKQRYSMLISGKGVSYPLPVNSTVFMREPRFSIFLGKEYEKTNESIFIVSGKVPVTIKLHSDDKDLLVNSRFELVYYVDTVFLYEDEQASTPFTYIWNTTGLQEGYHIFTINLLGYNMGVGINSIKVYVKNL